MPYARRFLHYSPGPTDDVGLLECRVAGGAWFELHRQGGCGDGEIVLLDSDSSGGDVAVGDWIAFEYDTNDRWYQGQVVSRKRIANNAVKLRLAGMSRQLDEVFPGGKGTAVADGTPPHRFAATDEFQNDPDYLAESLDSVNSPTDVVRLLVDEYIIPQTDITKVASLIEDPTATAIVRSLKVRGDESVSTILRDLATRCRGSSWGVNADGEFFFLNPKTTLLATFREGTDLVSLEQRLRHDLIFNRLLLTGDYLYGSPVDSAASARAIARWQGIYIQPASRTQYGVHEIAISLPWIRTQDDSREFAREFFRRYAQPALSFVIEVAAQSNLLKPWDGTLRLQDSSGNELFTGEFDSVRVEFDASPRFRIAVGQTDPHEIWTGGYPREHWPVADTALAGELITFSSSASSSESGMSSGLGSSLGFSEGSD